MLERITHSEVAAAAGYSCADAAPAWPPLCSSDSSAVPHATCLFLLAAFHSPACDGGALWANAQNNPTAACGPSPQKHRHAERQRTTQCLNAPPCTLLKPCPAHLLLLGCKVPFDAKLQRRCRVAVNQRQHVQSRQGCSVLQGLGWWLKQGESSQEVAIQLESMLTSARTLSLAMAASFMAWRGKRGG